MPNRGRLLCANEVDAVNVGEGSIRANASLISAAASGRQIRGAGKQTVAVDANGQKASPINGCFREAHLTS
jgi:hypothetical protein